MAELIPMPWLGQPADPAGSIQRGLEMADQWNRNRLFGLQRRAAELKVAVDQHQLDELDRMLRIREQNTVAFKEMTSIFDEAVQKQDTDPMTLIKLMSIVSRHPTLWEEPRTAQLLGQFNKAFETNLDLKKAQAEIDRQKGLSFDVLNQRARELGLEPSGLDAQGRMTFARPRTDPSTSSNLQKEVEFLRAQGVTITPEQLQQAWLSGRGAGEATPTSQMKNAAEIAELESKIAAMPDGAERKKLERQLLFLQQQTTPSGVTTEMLDREGNVISRVTVGKGGASKPAVPVVVSNELEKKITAQERSVALLHESRRLITPETVGPIGAVRELTEQVGNIVSPGSVPVVATTARQTFRTTAQNLFNSLKADSQINRTEASAIARIGDITDLLESSDTAQEKYKILIDLTALQAAMQSHQLGRMAPAWALRSMSQEQAERAWKRGDLSDEEVRVWGSLHK